MIAEFREEREQVSGAVPCGRMDAHHVERLVRVRDDVAETGGADETARQRRVNQGCLLQAAEASA